MMYKMSGTSDDMSEDEFSVESINNDDDNNSNNDDNSDEFDEEVLEEQIMTTNVAASATHRATSHDMSSTSEQATGSKQYDLNHYYGKLQDESIEHDFNPLSVLEKKSQRMNSGMISNTTTRQFDTKYLAANNKSISCKNDVYTIDSNNETMSFEESVCSETSTNDDDFSMSVCEDESTITSDRSKLPMHHNNSSEDKKLLTQHEMNTPRLNNNREGLTFGKKPSIFSSKRNTTILDSLSKRGSKSVIPNISVAPTRTTTSAYHSPLILSSNSVASSTAKRARELLLDLESGSEASVRTQQARSKNGICALIWVVMIVVLCICAVVFQYRANVTSDDDDNIHPTQAPQNEFNMQLGRSYGDTSNKPDLSQPRTNVPDMLYYADWLTSTCIEEDSSTKQQWDVGFITEDECCVAQFGWNVDSICSSTPAPTISTAHPTNASAGTFYADFVIGNCVVGDVTDLYGKYQKSFRREDECCLFNFSWDVNGICYTPIPTEAADSNSRRQNPSQNPSVTPSQNPSVTPTQTPTVSHYPTQYIWPSSFPTTSSSPTYDPSPYPSVSPTKRPTKFPTFRPSLSPTTTPSTSTPTKQPTLPPTSSPMKSPTDVPSIEVSDSPVTDRPIVLTRRPITIKPTIVPTNTKRSQQPTIKDTLVCPEIYDMMAQINVIATFFFSVVPSNSTTGNGLFCGRLEVEGADWLGLAISKEHGRMSESQGIIGSAMKGIVQKYNLFQNQAIVMSAVNQTLRKSSIYEKDGRTVMKFTKLLREDGEIPIAEDSITHFLYTNATTFKGLIRNFAHYDRHVSFKIDLSPSFPSYAPTISTIESTLNPSNKPTSAPTLLPTQRPTASPTTRIPSTPPSKRPRTKRPTKLPTTRRPISLPTERPIAITRKPSSSPTKYPTTYKPSLQPTNRLTYRPTSSPTSQVNILRTHLVSISPESLDSLDDEKSDQYLAMEWLLANPGLNSFSDERKIQRWVLAIIYRSLNGDEWTIKDGWTQQLGVPTDECTWHGVVCDSTSVVSSITLSENGLRGEIPHEIGLLANAKSLVFHTNSIWRFPPSVFAISSLQVLDLDYNFIQEIPSEMIPPSGSNMTELYLSNNQITFIPDELFQLQSVTHLWLANNQISSSLPSGLGLMERLVELDLEHNFFTGSIPADIYSLVNLQTLYLFDNMLTGTLSQSISQMRSLKIFDLHTNYISGVVPSQIGLLNQLSELHLGDNYFVGELPWAQLSSLDRSLQALDVSQNYLNSTIGAEIGMLSNLKTLRLDNNYRLDGDGILVSLGLRGQIPQSIGNLKQLEELRLDNNYLGSSIPNSIGQMNKLVSLRLESNNLQSNVPSSFGNLTSLQYLHLWSNYLTSTISDELGRLTQLRELFLDDNELTGTIPPELGRLANATYIALAENHLSGVIPTTFGKMTSLERLDLQFNNLVGGVPAQLSSTPLAKMKLEGNFFSGDIPVGVCQSVQILSGNCAVNTPTRRPSSLLVARTTPIPPPEWSCNCCTTCYSG